MFRSSKAFQTSHPRDQVCGLCGSVHVPLHLQSYLLRRYLNPPGTHPSPTFSEGTTGGLGVLKLPNGFVIFFEQLNRLRTVRTYRAVQVWRQMSHDWRLPPVRGARFYADSPSHERLMQVSSPCPLKTPHYFQSEVDDARPGAVNIKGLLKKSRYGASHTHTSRYRDSVVAVNPRSILFTYNVDS